MKLNKTVIFVLVSVLFAALAVSVSAEALPMDNYTFGAAPKQENYISADEYQDSSISVKIPHIFLADNTKSFGHLICTSKKPSSFRTFATLYAITSVSIGALSGRQSGLVAMEIPAISGWESTWVYKARKWSKGA